MHQPTRKYQKSVHYDSGRVEISRQAFTNPEELALDITASQGGFVEVYVYNGSASPVWYDQFSISSSQAVIIQENHYYPFGMQIAGLELDLDSRNRYKFNGIERQTDLDLGLDLALFRSYDPSIGRWHQVDPKASARESPYAGMGNNPIYYADPLGDTVRVGGLDVYTMVNLVWSLSGITGNNIGFENGVLVNHGKIDSSKPENAAGTYLDKLISSEGVIKVESVNGNELSSGREDGVIKLNTGQINDNLNSVGETMGFGMTFFHESLHTWTGTYAWAGANTTRNEVYGDPVIDPIIRVIILMLREKL
ncbi:RHS repeat-associated core domain-containing protein [Peijinzhouia sedimentorum]